MSSLEELKLAADAALKTYHEALRKYETALCESHPLQPGDTIKSTEGKLARVSHIRINWGLPEPVAYRMNKDGTIGKLKVSWWHNEWRNPEKVET